jgi:hypothetical protein
MIMPYQFELEKVLEEDTDKRAHGGAREGAGRHPTFEETMKASTLRLSEEHKEFIGNGRSAYLRALLAWGIENQEKLIDDPGYSSEARTTATLPPHVIEQAKALGQKPGRGAFISGVRRMIATAINLELDRDELVAEYGEGDE